MKKDAKYFNKVCNALCIEFDYDQFLEVVNTQGPLTLHNTIRKGNPASSAYPPMICPEAVGKSEGEIEHLVYLFHVNQCAEARRQMYIMHQMSHYGLGKLIFGDSMTADHGAKQARYTLSDNSTKVWRAHGSNALVVWTHGASVSQLYALPKQLQRQLVHEWIFAPIPTGQIFHRGGPHVSMEVKGSDMPHTDLMFREGLGVVLVHSFCELFDRIAKNARWHKRPIPSRPGTTKADWRKMEEQRSQWCGDEKRNETRWNDWKETVGDMNQAFEKLLSLGKINENASFVIVFAFVPPETDARFTDGVAEAWNIVRKAQRGACTAAGVFYDDSGMFNEVVPGVYDPFTGSTLENGSDYH